MYPRDVPIQQLPALCQQLCDWKIIAKSLVTCLQENCHYIQSHRQDAEAEQFALQRVVDEYKASHKERIDQDRGDRDNQEWLEDYESSSYFPKAASRLARGKQSMNTASAYSGGRFINDA